MDPRASTIINRDDEAAGPAEMVGDYLKMHGLP